MTQQVSGTQQVRVHSKSRVQVGSFRLIISPAVEQKWQDAGGFYEAQLLAIRR